MSKNSRLEELFDHEDSAPPLSKAPRLDGPVTVDVLPSSEQLGGGGASSSVAGLLPVVPSPLPASLTCPSAVPEASPSLQDAFNAMHLMMQQQNEQFTTMTRLVVDAISSVNHAARAAAPTPRGSPPGLATPSPPRSQDAAVGAALLAAAPLASEPKKLPDDVSAHLQKCAHKFQDNVTKFLRAGSHAVKLGEELEFMLEEKDGVRTRRYPPGVRPFKASAAQAELDAVLDGAAESDFSYCFSIPRGTTKRVALEMCHHEWSIFMKRVMKSAADSHLEASKPTVTKATYLAACNGWKPSLPGGGVADGLDDPVFRKTISGEQARRVAEENYTRVVDKARKTRDDAKKMKEDAKLKEETEEKALLQSKPSALLVDLIDARISSKVDGAGADAVMGDGSGTSPPQADVVVDALSKVSKNSLSPSAVAGVPKNGNRAPVGVVKEPADTKKGKENRKQKEKEKKKRKHQLKKEGKESKVNGTVPNPVVAPVPSHTWRPSYQPARWWKQAWGERRVHNGGRNGWWRGDRK